MKKVFFILTIFSFCLTIFILLVTDFPIVPSLPQKINLCKGQEIVEEKILNFVNERNISCLNDLSLDTLYQAKLLKVKVNTDHDFTMRVSFQYLNNELFSTDNLVVKSSKNKNATAMTYPLDNKIYPKFNRLVHGTHEVVFILSNKKDEVVHLRFDEIYLQ